MRYPRFDRSRLRLRPLQERKHLLDRSSVLEVDTSPPSTDLPELRLVGEAIEKARVREAPVVLLMGAHLLRAGVVHYLTEMMDRGWLTHIAMNGAGPIHDFEMARIGATTESVADYIAKGQFGLWQETGEINDLIERGARRGLGIGEALGQEIAEGPRSLYPHRDISLLAAAWQREVPVTVHVGIGYDIIHEHPNCSGEALGKASYEDFLIFTETIRSLEGGVVLNFGTAVMGPEVFLKALAMARNVAHQESRRIARFLTAVFDMQDLGEDFDQEPGKDDPRYYFRPLKTLLVRTVREGGQSVYVRGVHRETLPALFQTLHHL